MRIVVMGYIVRGALGGMAWHYMQYVLGLLDEGHEVMYIEDSGDDPQCYNPQTYQTGIDPIYGLSFINSFFSSCNIGHRWSYFDKHTNTWFGQEAKTILRFLQYTEIVINISGINPIRNWWSKIPIRIYIDTDPGFTQIRNLNNPDDLNFAAYHTHHFSFAENINSENCKIPADGFKWKTTRQPVFHKIWEDMPFSQEGNWTTVMQWESYKDQVFQNLTLGQKSISFEPYKNLPKALPTETFALAIGSSSAPRTLLLDLGWEILDPFMATKDPFVYQRFIKYSKAEWTVAKHGYVITQSGWFSERSANYLASSRPVVTQNTGFDSFIETGEGLLTFSNIEEAIESIHKVNSDYAFHSRKARDISREYFDSKTILKRLLSVL